MKAVRLDGGAAVGSHGAMSSPMSTADLCDRELPGMQVADPLFRDFGGHGSFCGNIRTLKVFEDNSLVRETLESQGHGCVLVVDGGGSLRCALLGDRLGELAVKNGWGGLVVFRGVRRSPAPARPPLGLNALASYQTAYMKANYPVEFFAASMAYDITSTDKLALFIDDMKRLGIKALACHPLKSYKAGQGRSQVLLRFAGVTFEPGQWLAGDEDGLVVLPSAPL